MNTRWKKMYNATMVVPIRIPYNANTVARSSVIGFCVLIIRRVDLILKFVLIY